MLVTAEPTTLFTPPINLSTIDCLALPYFPLPVVILTDEFFKVSAKLYLVLPFLSSESSTITLPLESNPLATT